MFTPYAKTYLEHESQIGTLHGSLSIMIRVVKRRPTESVRNTMLVFVLTAVGFVFCSGTKGNAQNLPSQMPNANAPCLGIVVESTWDSECDRKRWYEPRDAILAQKETAAAEALDKLNSGEIDRAEFNSRLIERHQAQCNAFSKLSDDWRQILNNLESNCTNLESEVDCRRKNAARSRMAYADAFLTENGCGYIVAN